MTVMVSQVYHMFDTSLTHDHNQRGSGARRLLAGLLQDLNLAVKHVIPVEFRLRLV